MEAITTSYKLGFALIAPDGSGTFGWDHMPTMESQLRYLVEHKTTKPDTVYAPAILLFLDEGPSIGLTPINGYAVDWLEITEGAAWVTRAVSQNAPRREQLERRPIHDLMGLSVGRCCSGLCKNILDGVEDTDVAVCQSCWASL